MFIHTRGTCIVLLLICVAGAGVSAFNPLDTLGSMKNKASGALSSIKHKAGDALDAAADKAGNAVDRVMSNINMPNMPNMPEIPGLNDLVEMLNHKVSEAIGSITRAANELAERSSEAAHTLGEITQTSIENAANASTMIGSATAALSDVQKGISGAVSSAFEVSSTQLMGAVESSKKALTAVGESIEKNALASVSTGVGEIVERAKSSTSIMSNLVSSVETTVSGVTHKIAEQMTQLIEQAVKRVADMAADLPETTALAVVTSKGVRDVISSDSMVDSVVGAAVDVGARVVDRAADTVWHSYRVEICAAILLVALLILVPIVGIIVICSVLCDTSRRLRRIERSISAQPNY